MESFQAVTAPGGLQTDKYVAGKVEGEYKRRLSLTVKGEPFKLFNFLVSKSVGKGEPICSYELYCFIFFQCLEKIRKVEKESEKMNTFVFISKFPLNFFFTNFKQMREDLIVYNSRIRKVLYSPRALGSEEFRNFEKDLQLIEKVIPGRRSFDFAPAKFIGVGYQDKGSSRNKAQDGSPSWQELAMSELKLTPRNKGDRQTEQLRILQLDSLEEVRKRAIRRAYKRRREECSFLG